MTENIFHSSKSKATHIKCLGALLLPNFLTYPSLYVLEIILARKNVPLSNSEWAQIGIDFDDDKKEKAERSVMFSYVGRNEINAWKNMFKISILNVGMKIKVEKYFGWQGMKFNIVLSSKVNNSKKTFK